MNRRFPYAYRTVRRLIDVAWCFVWGLSVGGTIGGILFLINHFVPGGGAQ